MLVTGLSPGVRLAALFVLAIGYATISIRPQPPGVTRLLMSLPVFLLFTLGPRLVPSESVIVSGTLGFMFAWLANFKLLTYSANRGPLSYPALQAWQWLLLLVLPYFPAKRGHQPARAGSVVLGLVVKLALAAALTLFLLSPQGSAYPVVRHAGYALYVWIFASLVLDGPMPLGCRLLSNRMALQPSMVNPFAATSVREFWGRRYNQIVSAILRDTVYLPILEGRWISPSSPGQQQHEEKQQQQQLRQQQDLTPQASAQPQPAPPPPALPSQPGPDSPPAFTPAAASTQNGVSVPVSGTDRPRTNGVGAGVSDLRHRRAPGAVATNEGADAPSPPSESESDCTAAPPPLTVSGNRRLLAMAAAFAVSGIMHEVCISYMCGGMLEGSYRMTAFFLLQPLIIIIQDAATAALLPRRLQPSGHGGRGGFIVAARLVQRAVTWALVLGCAEFLFWGPLERCGVDSRGLAEFMGVMRAVDSWRRQLAIAFGGSLIGGYRT